MVKDYSGNEVVRKKKLEMLRHIPGYVLKDLAEKHGLPKYGKVEELRERVAESISLEEIEDIYERFEDAGNVTIHLFKFDKSSVSKLRNESELNSLLKDHGLEDRFGKKKDIKLTSKPQIVLVELTSESKIKVKLEAKGETITKRNAETREIISFPPLVSSTALIHTDTGLVEVGARGRSLARYICDELARIFNDGREYQGLNFDEHDLEKIVDWAATLRNVTIKPLSGRISSLRITAAKDSDLRNEEIYRERERYIGECIRTGIYIQYEWSSGGKGQKVGLQINSRQGKIFFKSWVSEEVIDDVLSRIKEIKGLRHS